MKTFSLYFRQSLFAAINICRIWIRETTRKNSADTTGIFSASTIGEKVFIVADCVLCEQVSSLSSSAAEKYLRRSIRRSLFHLRRPRSLLSRRVLFACSARNGNACYSRSWITAHSESSRKNETIRIHAETAALISTTDPWRSERLGLSAESRARAIKPGYLITGANKSGRGPRGDLSIFRVLLLRRSTRFSATGRDYLSPWNIDVSERPF